MTKYTFEMLPALLEKIELRLERMERLILCEGCKELNAGYVSAQQAADMLNFTIATLYTKVCKGEIPYYKKGNRLYFSQAELKDWIEAGKKPIIEQIEKKAYAIVANLGNKRRS